MSCIAPCFVVMIAIFPSISLFSISKYPVVTFTLHVILITMINCRNKRPEFTAWLAEVKQVFFLTYTVLGILVVFFVFYFDHFIWLMVLRGVSLHDFHWRGLLAMGILPLGANSLLKYHMLWERPTLSLAFQVLGESDLSMTILIFYWIGQPGKSSKLGREAAL